MNITRVSNLRKLLLFLCVTATYFILLNTWGGSVFALPNQFPNPADFTRNDGNPTAFGDFRALVAGYNGTSYLLDAQKSAVRIYVPVNSAVGNGSVALTVTVNDAGHADGVGDAGSVPTRYELWSLDSDEFTVLNAGAPQFSGPNGNNITFSRNIGGLPASTIHPGYKVLEFQANAIVGNFGWNTFFISTNSGTYINYFKLLNYDKFAIKANPGVGSGDFRIRFAPDCSINSNTTRLLRWFDADAGQPNQNGQNPVNSNLSGNGPGGATNLNTPIFNTDPNPTFPAGPPIINGQQGQIGEGGNNVPGSWQVVLRPQYTYTWTWNNIQSSNGIQFGIPFDGFDYTFTCPPIDLCTNIPGNQASVPSGMVKNTPGNTPGICTTPPISTTGCEFNQPQNGLRIRVGESLPVSVRAYNGTAARWTGHTRPLGTGVTELPNTPDNSPTQWNTYLTVNNPNPYVGYVQKYDPHGGHGGTQGTLQPNTFSNWTPFAIDNTTLGPKTYSFYLVRKVPSTGSYVHLAPNAASASAHCTFSYTVYADPVGVIFGASCSNITGTISYQGAAGIPVGLLRIIRLRDGVQTAPDVGVGAIDAFGASNFFNKRPFVDWRLAPHESYRVELHMQNSLGEWQPNPVIANINNGNPCLQITACSAGNAGLSPEPGQTISSSELGSLYVSVLNETNNATFDSSYGYTTVITITGGLVPSPAIGPSIPANLIPGINNAGASTNLIANSTGTITVDFSFAGTSFANLGLSSVVPCNQTITPATRPYFKVFGGDVSAGGEFRNNGLSCNGGFVPTGGIRAFARAFGPPNDDRGAASEYGVLSLGPIDGSSANNNGFYSSDLHSRVGDYSTFANTVPIYWGGSLTGEHCIADYWHETSGGNEPTPAASGTTLIAGNTFDLNTAADDRRYYFNGGFLFTGVLRLPSATIPSGKQVTVYADGDVFITGNITYSYGAGFDYRIPSSIPYLTIIARGNIYVASSVTQLDGLFVAQPQTQTGGQANRGRFVSCVIDSGSPTVPLTAQQPNSFINKCQQKLLINGAVVAQRLKLWRLGDTTTTLFRAPSNENAQLYGAPVTIGREEIQYIPDIVLGIPAFIRDSEMPLRALYAAPPIF